jgi:hypothetical protein
MSVASYTTKFLEATGLVPVIPSVSMSEEDYTVSSVFDTVHDLLPNTEYSIETREC